MTTKEAKKADSTLGTGTIHYDVTALQMPIYFNDHGDHDPNGLMFALTKNVPILKFLRAWYRLRCGTHSHHCCGSTSTSDHDNDSPDKWEAEARKRAAEIGVELPSLNDIHAKCKTHPLVRPLVLRARLGDHVTVTLRNDLWPRDKDDDHGGHEMDCDDHNKERCYVGIHLIGDGYDVKTDDGSHIGNNPNSLVPPGGQRDYSWECKWEGVFPFHDGGNFSGEQHGTNVHGLFGALIVEPKGSIWRDPVTGRRSVDAHGNFRELDGLYLDVLPEGTEGLPDITESNTTLDGHTWPPPCEYPNFNKKTHREFVIFFHDEPEFVPAPARENPCGEHTGTAPHRRHGCECVDAKHPKHDPKCGHANDGGHGGGGGGGGGGGHGDPDVPPIMPISYRSEPMIDREYKLWEMLPQLKRPVLNEEQHHSSWLFGDPATPILKAYIGDPVRIRFVHAAVKETHVFHLHLYEWHAVAGDIQSPRIDAISVSPQTGHTIEPVWGAGNRHQVAGDVIWHCHLYPHFHEGMWGMFRTFETLQTGEQGEKLESADPIYENRHIGCYPDGTPIERLLPLPDRSAPPRPTPQLPGYPLYIAGEYKQKSPIPPWPDREYHDDEERICDLDSLLGADMPADFDYRPYPTDLERNAFNERPVPAELFTRNPLAKQQAAEWQKHPEFQQNGEKQVCHDMVVDMDRIDYNDHPWYDKDGHYFYLAADGDPNQRPGPKEPLFFRSLHGQIVNVILKNDLEHDIEETEFDLPFPPCPHKEPRLDWEGECATHVHMVKFDPICGDGASVGWNYISGARFGKRMVYRWWADQEFGTIFFHDHLFANYRQKHGLFGAMIVEPIGAKFYDNFSGKEIVSGLQARIQLPQALEASQEEYRSERTKGGEWFREFCIGIGDFIPQWDKNDCPLNPPEHPGGHGDQGVMALNYRNTPILERLCSNPDGDPAFWFNSEHYGDPDTTIFKTFADDPIWFRLIQGSHEESHSFQVHGMRWRRFRVRLDSPIRNQQTFGIAEAFTFINNEDYGPGDYMYKLSGADDLWLGCWGVIRAFEEGTDEQDTGGLVPLGKAGRTPAGAELVPPGLPTREFHVVAERRKLVYRDRGTDLIDPLALVYRVTKEKRPGESKWRNIVKPKRIEPLVLRCREGEVLKVTVENKLPKKMRAEKCAPEVPVDVHPEKRPVSTQVSMHADLLQYDVRSDDGANIGQNPIQSIGRGNARTYTWYAAPPPGQHGNAGEPLGPLLLQDMADFRNHRHHGLIGAIIVEANDATPLAVPQGDATAGSSAQEAWHGTRATVTRDDDAERFEEVVLLLQDGVRLFKKGNENHPVPDSPDGEDDFEHEDQGQKAFNYRSELLGDFDPSAPRDILGIDDPATPIWLVPQGKEVHLHLVGACDKPRSHSFTIHGVTWPEWRFPPQEQQGDAGDGQYGDDECNGYAQGQEENRVASESAITSGTVRTLKFTPEHSGDHAYRSGMLRWDVHAGLWGIIRVVE